MSPMEKMDEIVRALESLTEELAAEIEGRYASTKDHPAMERRYLADMEDVEVGRRALTLARELRDNAVEVRAEAVEPDDTACSCAKARSYEVHHACGHVYKIGDPALLILSGMCHHQWASDTFKTWCHKCGAVAGTPDTP